MPAAEPPKRTPAQEAAIAGLLEKPHENMKRIAIGLNPRKLNEAGHKGLRTLIVGAKLILERKPEALGEHFGAYKQRVSNAEEHLAKRKEEGESVADDIMATLRDNSKPIAPEQFADIRESLPHLEEYCGLAERVVGITQALEAREQREDRMKQVTEIMLKERRMRENLLAKVEKNQVELPPEAQKHMESIADTIRKMELNEEGFMETSRNFLDAVYGVTMKGLDEGETIERKNYDISKATLEYIVNLHSLHALPIKHLMEFAVKVEKARKQLPKKKKK